MLRRLFILMLLFATSVAGSQRLLTTPDLTSMTGRDGVGAATFRKVIVLPDSSMIVVGTFDVWYEGQRFRDLLKLKPNGEPDTSWRVDISYRAGRPGYLYEASLTPTGLFIAATDIELVNGRKPAAVPYVTLTTGRLINPATAAPTVSGYFLGNYDRSTGYVYILANGLIRGVSAITGEIDSNWQAMGGVSYSDNLFSPGSPLADSKGGLWQGWCDTELSRTACSVNFRRINIAPQPYGEMLAWPNRFTVPSASSFVGIGRDYTFASSMRYGADGVRDERWQTPADPQFITEKYAYLLLNGSTLVRAPFSGNGTPDSWRFPLPARFSYTDTVIPWATSGDDDGIAMLTAKNSYLPVDSNVYTVPGPPVFVVKDDQAGNDNPTVVEYYVPGLKRYFLTGRKNEQGALDGLPQSFTRTGMTFAAKSSRYRDIPEQPVCRLYASPEKGLSNSHFYGVGDDCVTLNKLTGLKYEGFDFSVLKPTSSGCSTDAPNAVSRLFNNKAAANDGNHRYVVSAATKAKMLTQGWIDEGAVFCSASVTDALN